MRNLTFIHAIGMRDGDYITLENQWARVNVTREVNDRGHATWRVDGEAECAKTVFTSCAAALEHAAEVLGLYARGRAD